MRKPGLKFLLNELAWTNQFLLPGTVALNANKLGGGALSKYKSPYGSSSTTRVRV
jgi:hypothetical protein